MLRTRLIAGVTSGFVLSTVFATVLTLLNFGETFFEPWRVEPSQHAPITLRLPRTTLRTFDAGEEVERSMPARTIGRGSVVNNQHLATHVRAYERSRRPPRFSHLSAYWLVHGLILIMMTAYLRRGSAREGTLLRTQVGLVSVALLFLIGNKAFLLFTDLPPYLLPIALVPLLSAFFLDRRTAMLMSAVLTLHSASLVAYDPIVCATYFAGCAGASVSLRARKYALSLVGAGLAGGLAAAGVYIAAKETFDGFSLEAELNAGLLSAPVCSLLSGVLSGVLASLLRPTVSRLLGVLSRSQMLYLTDLDQPLLRQMATEAPGSWEHSRAMANLAEAAAASIQADALLTRTGAYYHDLGKSIQPKYYIENLSPGEHSPHEELEPEVSADAIMAHVIEGTRILREGGIPEPVVEFTYTHHGTSVIEYFWHKCLKQGNPKNLTEDAFRYPGMAPRTKETAILMLIDSIEAGARTVEPPSREAFDELVQRVIFTKLKQGQLDDSSLSLEDLRTLSTRITDTLVSVYHSRIRYPWQEERDQQRAARGAGNGTDGVDVEHDETDEHVHR
ncbi:MAG TPA: HDIG domain-containing protein [Polyangiales bacterium]|nr:HDIG domain-containing protein [Polyangiales bacterium]